jgi:predicted component of type VI protein secretion system
MSFDTSTNPRRFAWTIRDPVVRLRQWATDQALDLDPSEAARSHGYKIGSGAGCAMRLKDRMVSEEHARVSFAEESWRISDLGSKNGVKVDGTTVEVTKLEPGMEVLFGKTLFLAEREVDRPALLPRASAGME